ncbi:Protein of unknown function [Bacillus mycoides]|nr:Protein of unknown function [Bacillus mycoides]
MLLVAVLGNPKEN